MLKVLEKFPDTGYIPKRDQSNIQEGNIQHQTKWREA
jgi:hypothetical protein